MTTEFSVPQGSTQSVNIRHWEPWKSSTGPATQAGKARASRNSVKHGLHSAPVRRFRRLLREYRRAKAPTQAQWEQVQDAQDAACDFLVSLAAGNPEHRLARYLFVNRQLRLTAKEFLRVIWILLKAPTETDAS